MLLLSGLEGERAELARVFLKHVYTTQREWWDAQGVNFLRLAVSWQLRQAEEMNDLHERLNRYAPQPAPSLGTLK